MANKRNSWQLMTSLIERKDLRRLERMGKRLDRDICAVFASPILVPPLKNTVSNNQAACGILIKLDRNGVE